jgi:hypothetical protein
MKAVSILAAGLAVAALSIAPATAGPPANAAVTSVPSANGAKIGCSFAGGFRFSSTCRDVRFKSYGECTTAGTKMGWGSLESYWYCSSLGLKN